MENLGTIVLAVGALGTASFGIVEGLKWTGIGVLGFTRIRGLLGSAVMEAVRIAFGPDYEQLLRAHYRTSRVSGALPTALRQGARIGLTPDTAAALATSVGVVEPAALREVATALSDGQELTEQQRNVLGRYELALDGRIDAALTLANSAFTGYMRVIASAVSIVIALAVGASLGQDVMISLIVGLAAVPVSPVAKDIAKGLTAAAQALGPRR